MTTSSRRSRTLIGRTPLGAPRAGGAHVEASSSGGIATASVRPTPRVEAESDVEVLEALAVDDFEDDDEWEDDDEDEDDDRVQFAAPRVGIRLGAKAPAAKPALPAKMDDDEDDDDDTIDPLKEWAIPDGLDVVETYRGGAFDTEGKALDSEVMQHHESESPFQLVVESEPESPYRDSLASAPRRDRTLPVLALLTSTAGLLAGAVLGAIGLVALVSIVSALRAAPAPPPPEAPNVAPPAEVPAAPVEPPTGEGEVDAPPSEPADEASGDSEPDNAAPKPTSRKKRAPEPEAPVPVAPVPAPEPVAPAPAPEPEPEPEDEKKGPFRKKKK